MTPSGKSPSAGSSGLGNFFGTTMRLSEWNISWKTLGDIAFCSLILRFLFAWWFANKRLGALILTVVALAGLVLLVDFLQLPLAKAVVLATALPVALLLIISSIPDIRRAYHSASFQNLFSLKQTMSEDLVKVLGSTVLELAQMRRGALLVFPQRDDIDPFLTGGEEYDARVTRSLLISLLSPSAPRHDGAIVISNGRIIRVGGVLPIGSSDQAREEWGTRHLAALGLAEMCDARVIIVSEERGTVSLAHDDEIDELPVVDERTVTDLVSSILYSHDRGEQQHVRFRHSVFLWMGAIGFSLIAAPVAAYLNRPVKVEAADTVVIQNNVPIFFSGVPEHLFIRSFSTNSCSVTFRLPPNEVNQANLDFRVNVNLTGLPPGATSINLTSQMIPDLPPHWEVSSYAPDKVEVYLADEKRMKLPIEPNFSGMPYQLHVVSFQCVPPEADVVIKDDAPTKNRRLATARINLGEMTAPGTYNFKTQVEYPASVHPASGSPDTPVQVTLVLQEEKKSHKK